MTSAGFGVCSEAIQAGKHLLVKPLAGQFEQAANAAALDRLNLGQSMDHLDDMALEKWLEGLEQTKTPYNWPNTSNFLADWINEGCLEPLQTLCNRAWSKTNQTRFMDPLNTAIKTT